MKPLVIYHGPRCIDGFAAAHAAHKYFGDRAEYVPIQYGGWHWGPSSKTLIIDGESHVVEDRDIYILDFSLSPEVTVALCECAEYVTVLDHHISSMERWEDFTIDKNPLPDNLNAQYDTTISGARMAWNYFLGVAYESPPIIDIAEDGDMWWFKRDNTKDVSAYLHSFEDWTFELFTQVGHLDESVIVEGNALLRQRAQQVKQVAANAVPCIIGDISGLAVNCPPWLASDVGHELAKKSGTYGACWHVAGHKVRVSLRADGNTDAAKLAVEHGGGGHRNAAGFELDYFPNVLTRLTTP